MQKENSYREQVAWGVEGGAGGFFRFLELRRVQGELATSPGPQGLTKPWVLGVCVK